MKRHLTYYITKEKEGMKILSFLLEQGYSTQNITNLKKIPQSILRNGTWAYVNEALNAEDKLEVFVVEETSSPNIVATPMDLDIVYEDEDILVINKPAGLPVHPSQNHYTDTLANGVMHHFESQGISYVFRCMNRLDKDTSGLVLLAKHMVSGAILSTMVQKRQIKREYVALVAGKTPETGIVDKPIGRVEGSTIERKIDFENGKRAVTHFTRLDYNEKQDASKLLLWLETGRTHQIRVHMKSEGHPLFGDYIYWTESPSSKMNRQALHSYCLTFNHPITGKEMVFTAKEPEDMSWFLEKNKSKKEVEIHK